MTKQSKIAIISSSVREERSSHRVALYFKQYLEEQKIASVEILDLDSYQFPIFTERLHLQKNPLASAIDFAERIAAADGVLIVTPEYNGGYPASLKNVVDLLYNEWYHKPIAISTVSSGTFGGSQVFTSLQFTLWKIRAFTVPATFPVSKVDESFDELGQPSDKMRTDKRAESFIKEFLWCMEARNKMPD